MRKSQKYLLIALLLLPFLTLLRHIMLGVAEWTPPMTWTSALFTVDQGNTQIRNNFEWLFAPDIDVISLDEADKTTTSTTFVDVDAAGDPDLSLSIETFGEDVLVHFEGCVNISSGSAGTGAIAFDVAVDGTRIIGDDGLAYYLNQIASNTDVDILSFTRRVQGLASGVHTFTLQWKVRAAAGTPTGTLYCGGGTSLTRDTHPHMWVGKG